MFQLARRIDTASHAGDTRRVHRLQQLLLKSPAAKLLAGRRVTQANPGKNTAGIAGSKALTPHQRWALAAQLGPLPTGSPPRRGWIPKPGKDDKRPLSIPTRHDRALQALVKLVLDPAWEARCEPHSYGFRPGRAVHDALGAIFSALEQQPKYALDADIATCFDRIDHHALRRKLTTFPTLNRLVKAWLQAGVLANNVCTDTPSGPPQGGVASPLLANSAVHGLEAFLRAQFPARTRRNPAHPGRQLPWQPQVIRYADDLVILPRARTVIEQCRHLPQGWLRDSGLELSEQKTRTAPTLAKVAGAAGCNFLGFQGRQYRASKDTTARGRGCKTLIRPSKEAVKRHWATLSAVISQHKAAQQAHLLGILHPSIAGWANYSRAVGSTKPLHLLAHRLDEQRRRWAFFRHPRKSRRWASQRYWATTPGNSWACRDSNGPTLNQPTRVPMVRHVKVPGQASPYDGNGSYGAARRGTYPGGARRRAALLQKQAGPCEACGRFFKPEDLLELHHRDGNRSDNRSSNLAAVHRHGHDQRHGGLHALSQQGGTHDKRPLNCGAVGRESGMHGFEDQRGERSPR